MRGLIANLDYARKSFFSTNLNEISSPLYSGFAAYQKHTPKDTPKSFYCLFLDPHPNRLSARNSSFDQISLPILRDRLR
jgi:hypothetical protein